jgi:hypothetical protein
MAFIPPIINTVFSMNNKNSRILTEAEPFILLLFGPLLFSATTGIKLKF